MLRKLTILVLLLVAIFYIKVQTAQAQPNPYVPDTENGIRTDPNGGRGGYWPGRGPGSPCTNCGPVQPTWGPSYEQPSNNYSNYQNRQSYRQNNNWQQTNNYRQTYNNQTYSRTYRTSNRTVNNYNNYETYQQPQYPYSGGGYYDGNYGGGYSVYSQKRQFYYDLANTGINLIGQYTVQKSLIKSASKEARIQEQINFEHQMELLKMQSNIQQQPPPQQSQSQSQSQYQQQGPPAGPAQESVSWTRISVTNCLPTGVQLFFNDQPIYLNNGTILASWHRVPIEIPMIGGVITVLRADGSFVQRFEMRQGLTTLIIK